VISFLKIQEPSKLNLLFITTEAKKGTGQHSVRAHRAAVVPLGTHGRSFSIQQAVEIAGG
jgi:hypothetical protein